MESPAGRQVSMKLSPVSELHRTCYNMTQCTINYTLTVATLLFHLTLLFRTTPGRILVYNVKFMMLITHSCI